MRRDNGNIRDPRWPNRITYHYVAHITCLTCGKESVYDVYSVNSNKQTCTFKPRDPLTGLGGMNSVVPLQCGHLQDLEGHPVERAQA